MLMLNYLIWVLCNSIAEGPCTFELGFCGWQTFTNISVNGVNVTTTWKIRQHSWPLYTGYDFSYFSYTGMLTFLERKPLTIYQEFIIFPVRSCKKHLSLKLSVSETFSCFSGENVSQCVRIGTHLGQNFGNNVSWFLGALKLKVQ